MDPAILRRLILEQIERHEATGSNTFLDDTDLAAQLNAPIADVQRQLLILENRELVQLAKTFGPRYGARLTASGLEALEAANRPPAPGGPRIGF